MKPAPFDYFAPKSLEEALELVEQHGDDGKLLAGGQSLIPVMNFRLAQPSVLIDLNEVDELAFVRANGGLHLGAMTRQRTLERDATIRQHAPLIHQTMPLVAHAQIRNRGTLGGSLAHADPAAELPVLAVALEAQFKLQKRSGERWVSAVAFYQSLFTTALEPEEILTEIVIPARKPQTGYAFQEFARRHGDYAQAGVAAIVTLDDDGVCAAARLVYLNVGDIPMVASQAMGMLVGERLTDEVIAAAAQHAARYEIAPGGDVHGSAEYKRHLANVLARRALRQSVVDAGVK